MNYNNIDRLNGNKYLISVVLPVFNLEPYIGEAIESILNQHFVDFELIIIDDASTDNTYEIIQSYKDNRMVVLRNDVNTGNYPSRNKGVRIAKGKYIAVMDGDDISMPERFMVQYTFMENNPDILACGSFNTLGGSMVKRPQSHEDIMFALLINSCFFHSSLFIRKKAIETIGDYNENYIYASDYDLICRLTFTGKLMILPEQLIHYRFHPDQITQLHWYEQKRFANQVRRKYQLAMIKRYQGKDTHLPKEADLAFPLMGRVIFFYHYAKNNHSMKYEKVADDLLNNILENIYPNIPVCLEEGLSGLCCGLIYLLCNRFIEAEGNILEDINNCIEKGYLFLDNDSFYHGKKGVDYYKKQYFLVRNKYLFF
jgi:glycosyltransferase involved in cell wall biosynthesis